MQQLPDISMNRALIEWYSDSIVQLKVLRFGKVLSELISISLSIWSVPHSMEHHLLDCKDSSAVVMFH
jgi:hypothetical protein